MATQEVKRKLTAILSADVKGYSRLMGEDEVGTIRTLHSYKEVMAGFIQHHHGRVVDAPGDNLLAEFASVVDAVECGVEIQKELKTRNSELPENRRMEFRIGVNLGDVVEEGERIFGDGVNIAARLESLSEARGICISGTAYDQVKNKLPLGYKFLGEQTVKNIPGPVRVYRVLMEPEAVGKVIGEKRPRQWQMAVIGLVIVFIIAMAAVVVWKLSTPPAPQTEVTPKEKITVPLPEKPSATILPSVEVAPKEKVTPSPEKVAKPTPPPPKIEVASKDKMAFPLPDKPSIAVLPFVNMSEDKEQEYFSDGITEEIITALSKTPHLFVISRQSTFTYKGKPVKVKQVSEELGVRYVLEGSVRKAGNKVRITAQLIDAITGHHLWAERYDRDIKDIFAIQDEITKNIITALQVKLTYGEQAHVMGKGTKNLEAYLKCLQAIANLTRMTKEGNALGRKLAEEAIVLDPKYPRPYVALAQTYMLDVLLGATDSPEFSFDKATALLKKAIALDDSEPDAHSVLGYMYTMRGEHEKAIAEAERAVSLNPNAFVNLSRLGFVLLNAGRAEEAISGLKNARRLSPSAPHQAYFLQLTTAYRLTGRYKEAIETAKEALRYVPNSILIHVQLTATYSMMGREEEARASAAEVMKINPKFSLERYAKTLYFKNQADRDRTIDALRKAGLK